MKLWLIEARADLPRGGDPWRPSYDKTLGAVVRAETEADARAFMQTVAGDEKKHGDVWNDARYSACTEVTPDGEPGVLLAG